MSKNIIANNWWFFSPVWINSSPIQSIHWWRSSICLRFCPLFWENKVRDFIIDYNICNRYWIADTSMVENRQVEFHWTYPPDIESTIQLTKSARSIVLQWGSSKVSIEIKVGLSANAARGESVSRTKFLTAAVTVKWSSPILDPEYHYSSHSSRTLSFS